MQISAARTCIGFRWEHMNQVVKELMCSNVRFVPSPLLLPLMQTVRYLVQVLCWESQYLAAMITADNQPLSTREKLLQLGSLSPLGSKIRHVSITAEPADTTVLRLCHTVCCLEVGEMLWCLVGLVVSAWSLNS